MDSTATPEVAVPRLAPEAFAERAAAIELEVGKVIVGQRELVRQTLTGLLANSHVLLEGVPGLGKTMLVRTIADVIDCTFSRVQFTPDLMPADITGTNILVEEGGQRIFKFQSGPIFANLVLADEINRATPKTQSSLLEAMQEHQVTVARLLSPESCRHGFDHVRGNGFAWPLPIQPEPALLRGLTPVAVAHARQELQVALVFVPPACLPADGSLRRDIEEDREVRSGQEPLDFGKPHRIQALGLSVRDARRDVAVTDQDDAGFEEVGHFVAALVPVGDVQELHDVGAVLTLAVQRLSDLRPDGRCVVRKREQPALASARKYLVAHALGLRLFAALIQPFDGYEYAVHRVGLSVQGCRSRARVWSGAQRS
jgi:hypothetical protein